MSPFWSPLSSVLSWVLLLACGFGPAAVASPPVSDSRDETLQRYLRGLNEIAGLYRDNALSFSCEEKIFNHTHYGRKSHRSFYVYRYDEEQGLSDFRLRYRFNPKKEFKPKDVVHLADFDLPVALSRAYSWIFIFEADKKQVYRYELAGEAEVFGRPAAMIRFEAIPPYVEGINEWVGTAWIDAESAQLLRVEAYRPDEYSKLQGLERARQALAAGTRDENALPSYHSVEVIDTEFEVVQNGMRFPSEVRIERRTYDVPGNAVRGHLHYLVRQKYFNYQFFKVRTATEIEAATGGSR